VGYELTRMLRASQMLPGLGRPEQAVALELADICMDATRRPPQNMNAGARVCEDLGIPMGSLGNILAKMAARGLEVRVPIGKDKNGRLVYAAKGHALDFLFPSLPPRAIKGPLNDGPLMPEPVDNAPDTGHKGPLNDGPLAVKGPLNDGAIELKGPRFEAQRSTESWTPTPVTPKSKEDARRVGDPIADKLPEDQGQERSVAKSQNRRLPDGSGTVADDAQQFPPDHPESPAAGGHARAREPAAPARRCEFEGCAVPEKALPDDSRFHVGCDVLARLAERAQAAAVAL
jgi:hypothetical protein